MATINEMNINGTLYDIQDTVSGYLTSASAASTYLSKTDANSTYLKIADASSTYLTKSQCNLYTISKSTSSGTSVQITVPGHANATYDRIAIWCWGNMNGTPYYGIIRTTSSSDGTGATATFTGNYSPSCTYENSGSDRIITVNGLPSWGTLWMISMTQIK